MTDVVQRVHDIGSDLEGINTEADEQRYLPETAMKQLSDTGLFRLLQPKDFGGEEAHLCEFLESVMAVGSHSPSAGWISGVVGVHPLSLIHIYGLAFDLSLRDNLSLPMLGAKGRWWFVSKRWQQINAEQAGERFGIQPKDPNLLIRQFSGGNQQKALMAKWLSVGPKLLILHEPTQAVDVGARQDILRQIHSVADTGVSILLVLSLIHISWPRSRPSRPAPGRGPTSMSSPRRHRTPSRWWAVPAGARRSSS